MLAVGKDLGATDAEIFDAAGYIASPGFVDTHHHVWQSAIRALTADWSLADYFAGIRVVTAPHFRPEDMYAANRHGLLEALHAGVTTTADYCHNLITPDHAEEALRGTREAGARVIWCYGFQRPTHGRVTVRRYGSTGPFSGGARRAALRFERGPGHSGRFRRRRKVSGRETGSAAASSFRPRENAVPAFSGTAIQPWV